MNKAQLDAFLAERGYKVDEVRDPHRTTNPFRVLYIGTGVDKFKLLALRKELLTAMPLAEINVFQIQVEGHPNYGQQCLEIDGIPYV